MKYSSTPVLAQPVGHDSGGVLGGAPAAAEHPTAPSGPLLGVTAAGCAGGPGRRPIKPRRPATVPPAPAGAVATSHGGGDPLGRGRCHKGCRNPAAMQAGGFDARGAPMRTHARPMLVKVGRGQGIEEKKSLDTRERRGQTFYKSVQSRPGAHQGAVSTRGTLPPRNCHTTVQHSPPPTQAPHLSQWSGFGQVGKLHRRGVRGHGLTDGRLHL